MKYRILVLLSVILVSLAGIAQDNVTGVVLNEKGKPVKKVKMRVKGRMKMLSTSSKGTFELGNVKTGDTLLVYPNRKLVAYVPMSGIPTYTIHLGKNSLCYATSEKTITCMYQKIPEQTYNSNIITYERIQQLDVNNLIDLLRGNIAGLQINYSDGQMKASIRGSSSFALSTEPLFIVGGTEYNSLEEANNAVSVEDIREVEIKKDGSELKGELDVNAMPEYPEVVKKTAAKKAPAKKAPAKAVAAKEAKPVVKKATTAKKTTKK